MEGRLIPEMHKSFKLQYYIPVCCLLLYLDCFYKAIKSLGTVFDPPNYRGAFIRRGTYIRQNMFVTNVLELKSPLKVVLYSKPGSNLLGLTVAV